MRRTSLVLSAVLVTACVKSGGRGPVRSGGSTVHRTTATGSGVGSVKGGAGPKGGKNVLLTAGLITLGVSYGTTVVSGQIVKEFMFTDFDREIGGETTVDKLWIPVFGAWGALAHNVGTVHENCSQTIGGVAVGDCTLAYVASSLIAIGAIAQTTGVVLIVQGLLNGAKDKGGGDGSKFVVAPHASENSAGLTVTGAF